MANIKRTIAIVCGGDSSEHDVSMRSAQGLYSFFDKDKYDLYIVDIKGQDWHVDFPDGTIAPIDRNDFSFRHNGKTVVVDYAYITIDDKVFVPFAAVDNADRGNWIGIVDGDENNRIYEYKDYSSNEWIISFYNSGEMDGSMLMREQSVNKYPDNLTSEYDWNN